MPARINRDAKEITISPKHIALPIPQYKDQNRRMSSKRQLPQSPSNPAPRVSWRQIPEGPNETRAVLSVSVDRTWDMPGFVAKCNHPCWTRLVALPTFGGGGFMRFSPRQRADRVGVVLLQSLPAGQAMQWHIEPITGEVIKIDSVSMMTEKEIGEVKNSVPKQP